MADEPRTLPTTRHADADSPLWIAGLFGLVIILIGVGIMLNWHSPTDLGSDAFKHWRAILGVVATLAVFTILYKENPLFRFMEHIFIGLATGFGLIYIWFVYVEPQWFVPMLPAEMMAESAYHAAGEGKWWLFPAVLVGSLFFTVYFPRLAWMNRFALSVFMGVFAGFALQMFFGAVGPQITASFRAPVTTYPVNAAAKGVDAINHIQMGNLDLFFHPWTLLALVVLFCVMAFFFFSVEHKHNWIRLPANAGRYFLMITLGAIFGTTVMGRLSLLIERLGFLIESFRGWLHWG